MKTLEQATHLGIDFENTNGVRCRSYQLLNERGIAVATADFEGEYCSRFVHVVAPSAAERWLLHVKSLNSKP